MLLYSGRVLKIVTKDIYVKKQDFQTPYSYCGIAAPGSAENDSVWKITRIEVLNNGTVTTAVATAVKWTDRYTSTYI
jgi:hypothetical protein